MKTSVLNRILYVVIGMFIIISCEDSASTDINNEQAKITEDEMMTIVESDDVADDVDNVVDDYFNFDESGISSKSIDTQAKTEHGSLDCVTKTIVITDTEKTVTLDFGEGCELPNGNILSGKIILSFEIDFDESSFTITRTYENFYHNDVKIEGTCTMLRVRENDNGNPQVTLTFDKTITWPDGEIASKKGTKVREWIEGHDTRTWGDDVIIITGNWEVVKKDGTMLSAEITTPLRREMACRFIVSGVIELTKNEVTGTLNFGDGECDNIAVFTNSDGEETEIILRKRKRF